MVNQDQARILVVEDNPDDEAMTLFALKKHGLTNDIVVARDGEQALAYMFENSEKEDNSLPDLILLDLKLPEIDGFEVLRRIRESERTQLIPIVMLTTSDEESDRRRCYELCANSYVRKPVDFDKFVELIHLIGRYWLGVNETPTKPI